MSMLRAVDATYKYALEGEGRLGLQVFPTRVPRCQGINQGRYHIRWISHDANGNTARRILLFYKRIQLAASI